MEEGQVQEDLTREVAFAWRQEAEHGLVLQTGLAGEVRGAHVRRDVKTRHLEGSRCTSCSGSGPRFGVETREVAAAFVSSVGAPWRTATLDPICPSGTFLDPQLYTLC